MVEGKTITTDHPVAYVSGLFRGSQLNWAALTKEAYAIYMSFAEKHLEQQSQQLGHGTGSLQHQVRTCQR